MAQDIKQKIVLEGEKEYRDSIRDAQRNLKTLRSELKAETAELGKNATEQQKAEVKAKSLKKQIEEQEKIVKANRDALEEVKTKYADNADAIAKYEQKLNESRTALANMKNELSGVGDGFKTLQGNAEMATVASKSVADSIEKLSAIGDTISGSIETIFTGMLDTIKQAIGVIWGDLMDIAAKADNYIDMAEFLGADPTEVEKWDNAMKAANADMSTMVALVTKLKYNNKSEKALAKWFGISPENYTNDLEFAELLFNTITEKRDALMKNGKWDDAMEAVFGSKKVQDVYGILSDWDEIVGNLETFDAQNGGYGLGEEELKTMNELHGSIALLQTKWNAFKESVETKLFGGIAISITDSANKAMDALMKYFSADNDEEREQALEDLEKNITEAFERIKKAIEDGIKLLDELAERLKDSDDPTTKALGNILSGFVDALQWLTEDNMNHVVNALDILAGFWIVGKGATMAAKIASMVANINLIKAFSAGGAAAETAATATATGAAGSGAAGIFSYLAGIAAPYAIFKGFEWAAGRRNNTPEHVRGTEEYLEANAGGDRLRGAFTSYVEAQRELQELLDQGLYDDERMGDLYARVDATKKALDALAGSGELLQAYSDWRQENSYGNMDWVLPSDWWQTQGGNSGNTDAMTGADARDMTGTVRALPSEIKRSLSGMTVTMDGQTVGRLVAPYVSQQIAVAMIE